MRHLAAMLLLWLCLPSIAALAADNRTLAVQDATTKRLALVIGNAAYPGPGALKNPANDARDIGGKLKRLGFEVILRTDLKQKDMLRALTEFGDKVQPGTEALFFYAGHGMQVRGKNYLIPVDAEIKSESSVSSEAVDVDQLLDKLAPARLSMVILDACRNNPFERRFRGGGQGLAQINAPTGTLIAYATAPGKVAADGEGRNGLYTSELLAAMDVPGIKIEDVFKRVRANVVKKSYEAQTPWESSSLTGDFYFQPSPSSSNALTPTSTSARQSRLALLIGVSDYRNLPQLPNVRQDVALMERTLAELGFTVTRSEPKSREALATDLAAQAERIAREKPEIVVVYYAGHGGRLDGDDWMLPTAIEHDTPEKIRATGYALYEVWRALGLAGSPSLNLFFYDTSRTPPPYRAAEEAKMPPRSYRLPNTVFAFAAAPGQHATEGADGQGLFTSALVRNLKKPGVTLDAALKSTAADMARLAPEKFSASAVVEGDTARLLAFRLDATGAPTGTSSDKETLFWQSIQGSTDPADYADYLAKYPDGEYASLAKRRAESPQAKTAPPLHPFDGLWVGELETYGGLFSPFVKMQVELRVANSVLSGVLEMYGETRALQARLDAQGNIIEGRLSGAQNSYTLGGTIASIQGKGSMGWKLRVTLRRKP